ncbi:MAG: ankyrin repeat domain-containing protein [Gammaproteobacteria bacterium]
MMGKRNKKLTTQRKKRIDPPAESTHLSESPSLFLSRRTLFLGITGLVGAYYTYIQASEMATSDSERVIVGEAMTPMLQDLAMTAMGITGYSLTSLPLLLGISQYLGRENNKLALSIAIAEQVIANGVPVYGLINFDAKEKFFTAVEKGEIDEIKKLAPTVNGVNIQDAEGNTAAHLAVKYIVNEHLRQEVLETLVELGANLEIKNYPISGWVFGSYPGQTSLELLKEKGATSNWIAYLEQRQRFIYEAQREKEAEVIRKKNINKHKEEITKGISELCKAVKINDPKTVKEKEKFITQAEISTQQELLLEAIKLNSNEIVSIFLTQQVNVNFQDNDGNAPLHYAIEKKNLDMVKLLFNHGAYALPINNQNETPYHIAAKKNHPSVLEFVLSKDNDRSSSINFKDRNENSPLIVALENNHLDLANILLEKGASVNVADNAGNTPLMLALKAGHTNFARACAEKYAASLGNMNSKGQDPIIISVFKNSQLIKDFVKETHIDVNHQDIDNKSALIYSVIYGWHTSFNALIAHEKIDPNISDGKGTALHYAAEKPLEKSIMVEKLIDKGANLDLKNSEGNTVVHLLIINKAPELLDKVIAKRANINIINGEGNSPIHLALRHREEDIGITLKLVSHGADLKQKNNSGFTAIEIAFLTLRHEIIEKVVSLNPQLKEWKNEYGYSLYQIGEIILERLNDGCQMNEANNANVIDGKKQYINAVTTYIQPVLNCPQDRTNLLRNTLNNMMKLVEYTTYEKLMDGGRWLNDLTEKVDDLRGTTKGTTKKEIVKYTLKYGDKFVGVAGVGGLIGGGAIGVRFFGRKKERKTEESPRLLLNVNITVNEFQNLSKNQRTNFIDRIEKGVRLGNDADLLRGMQLCNSLLDNLMTSSPGAIDLFCVRAYGLHRQEKWEEANFLCQNILIRNSGYARAQQLQAVIAKRPDRLLNVNITVNDFENLKRNQRTNFINQIEEGVRFGNDADLLKGMRLCERLLAINPDAVDLLCVKACGLYGQGQLNEARTLCDDILEINRNYVKAQELREEITANQNVADV